MTPNRTKIIPAIAQRYLTTLTKLEFGFVLRVNGNNTAPIPVIAYNPEIKIASKIG